MVNSNMESNVAAGLEHDPRELAAFLDARIADDERHAAVIAELEEAGSAFEPALSSVRLRAEAAAKRHLLEIHGGPSDQGSFCRGCVGPFEYEPRHDGHCHVQLVLALIWETHPDFPTWVATERITGTPC